MSLFSHNNLYSNSQKCNFIVGSPGWCLRKDHVMQTVMTQARNEDYTADEFKQYSHFLQSAPSLMKGLKKFSSNWSHELLHFGCWPVAVSPTILVIGESLTQKGLGPPGRGERKVRYKGLKRPVATTRDLSSFCCEVLALVWPTWAATQGPGGAAAMGGFSFSYVLSQKLLCNLNRSIKDFSWPNKASHLPHLQPYRMLTF